MDPLEAGSQNAAAAVVFSVKLENDLPETARAMAMNSSPRKMDSTIEMCIFAQSLTWPGSTVRFMATDSQFSCHWVAGVGEMLGPGAPPVTSLEHLALQPCHRSRKKRRCPAWRKKQDLRPSLCKQQCPGFLAEISNSTIHACCVLHFTLVLGHSGACELGMQS